jgi:hypothetical protein
MADIATPTRPFAPSASCRYNPDIKVSPSRRGRFIRDDDQGAKWMHAVQEVRALAWPGSA